MKLNNYWDFLPNFDNKYIVSRDGRIVSLDYNGTKEIKELSQFMHTQYLAVKLTKNGESICYAVHRAVAETFIPNPDNLPEVNHKSGIKTENFVENLEWCTRSENVQHAYNIGLKQARSGEEHPKSEPVRMFDLKMNKIKDFISYTECCKYLNEYCGYKNAKPSYISRVALGNRKRYGKYTFRRINDIN